MKRILFIAYFYPPLGGPGVQRPIKTIKYLKKYGWEVDVLTVADIQFHSYDYELLKESQADNIYKAKSFDVMSIYKKLKPNKNDNKLYFNTPERYKKMVRGLFPIDDKIGWFPFAYKKALGLLRAKKYDAIVATIGPNTSGYIAYKLHKKTNIPYFIDYRDHWTLHTYPHYSCRLLFKHAQRFEKKMLQAACGVFVVGKLKKEQMITHFGENLRDKIEVVYNGFDEDDFLSRRGADCHTQSRSGDFQSPDTPVRIRYVGNFFGHRTIEPFIKALSEMKAENSLPESVKFEFIGNYFIETLKLLKTEELAGFIDIIPQVDHPKAVDYMRTADLLLLFVPTADGDDFVPGKVFEYIRTNVPILAMIPESGEPAQILRELGHKYICHMEDVSAIKAYLKDFFRGENRFEIKYDSAYSRENQTKLFAEHLDRRLI